MQQPDYGIDAPGVIRNLALAGFALLIVSVGSLAGLLPKGLAIQPVSGLILRLPLGANMLIAALSLFAAAAWMYFGSRFRKTAERDRLLNMIEWTGHERVLDVGCGRGLLLVGAAKRLDDGVAAGIDIWQAEDLSGNAADVPLKNAALEGVKARVAVHTADVRRLPFRADSFDVIVSRAALHNIYSADGRADAVREIARVLKPGGRALISDIRHHREYARTFSESGCGDVRLMDSRVASALLAVLTIGSLRPNTMLARKSM